MRANDGSRTGGEVLVDQLLAHGVRHVFCVPGESYLAALDAFHDRDVEITICRQEGGASMMAEAVGKRTGRPGICFVTRGPGATNASPGIHIAKQDSTPLIVFVGQVAREMREREAFQELDYRAVFGTMTKWATEIDDAARIPEIVSRAFHVATNGRPGPVVIALPEDMLTDRVIVPDAPAFEPIETWPGLTDMVKLQKLLWAAKAPVMLLGGSHWSQAACDATMRFAERFALPVATTFRRAHLFDAMHSCYAGDLGIGPNPKLLARIKGADLVVLVGGRMGEMPSQSYTLFEIPHPRQTFVHVHPSTEEIGRLYRAASRHQRDADRVRGRARRPAAAERSCRGATAPAPRMRIISPGPAPRRSSRAKSTSARFWSGCASSYRPTQCSATAPEISPAGFIAFTAFAVLAPRSRRPPARWVTACRLRSASNVPNPSARWSASPATATS